jgi:mRNA-degrading endonuclease HigB of HigAB toxin-antitoxin module
MAIIRRTMEDIRRMKPRINRAKIDATTEADIRRHWATPADVKRAIRSASILKDGRAVFNIAGNKYRIVVWINYPYRVVYVRFVGTHRQYDRIDAQSA